MQFPIRVIGVEVAAMSISFLVVVHEQAAASGWAPFLKVGALFVERGTKRSHRHSAALD